MRSSSERGDRARGALSLVADNPYYPHEVSFYRDISPGFWAWTCSPSLVVQANSARYVFTAAFPAGRSHYLAFYGVKPFTNIQLYDIDYSPDNEFESYDASGYLYKKDMGALYIKMKHKNAPSEGQDDCTLVEVRYTGIAGTGSVDSQ